MIFAFALNAALAADPAAVEFLTVDDAAPQRYEFSLRASDLDPAAKAHPELGFYIERDGKPADRQVAAVDTRVPLRGRLVIWLMGPKPALFERLNGYGLHVIQPHYARHWYGRICRDKPVGPDCRGNARLEATTGIDASDDMDLTPADGMAERARQMVVRLAAENPQARWDAFLDDDDQLIWDRVIVSGASHGASSAARFAVHQRVARVVCLCGPRDQFQRWQGQESATPANRFFGFTHTLDYGWSEDHYCRSWQMLGLERFGPLVDVDASAPPFRNSRRLLTSFDVDGDAKRAHSSVTPGPAALKKNGQLAHEPVWRYLYTHPVDEVGQPVEAEPCDLEQSQD